MKFKKIRYLFLIITVLSGCSNDDPISGSLNNASSSILNSIIGASEYKDLVKIESYNQLLPNEYSSSGAIFHSFDEINAFSSLLKEKETKTKNYQTIIEHISALNLDDFVSYNYVFSGSITLGSLNSYCSLVNLKIKDNDLHIIIDKTINRDSDYTVTVYNCFGFFIDKTIQFDSIEMDIF